MKSIHDLLGEHKFFKPFSPQQVATIASCGRNVQFDAETYIAHEGNDADYFYLLRSGLISIELHLPIPGRQVVQTLKAGDIMGWSWIYPPYKWHFDLRVTKPVAAVALDGRCLRNKCEEDHSLGYLLMKEFANIMTGRLKAARIQMLDIYGGSRND